MRRIAACFGLILLSGCTSGGQPAVSRLGQEPVVSGGKYTSGGGLSVAAEVRNDRGATLVCGVWAQSVQQSALTALAEQRVLGTGSVFLGRERIAQNLLFMKEVAPSADYGGSEAGCLRLTRAWTVADAAKPVKIRIPQQVVLNDSGDFLDGGVIVRFIQTGPEAGGQ